MALTQTEVLGFNTKVIAAINQHQAACLTKGLDVSTWAADQDSLAKNAGKQDAIQEQMKDDLKTQTQVTDTSFKTVYDTGSSRLDAMAGALGKTTDTGKSLLALRSSIRSGPHEDKSSGSTTTGKTGEK